MAKPSPRPQLAAAGWSEEQRAEFLRRRRGRNLLLLAALAGVSLMIFAIALVKLHGLGRVW
jgi:hypothetical protein